MNRLNFGCGHQVVEGWTNADIVEYDSWPPIHSAEWVARGPVLIPEPRRLPWHDQWFDGAVCHHVLHEIPWPALVPTLVELRRVMKPGAWLRITAPDLIGALYAFAQRDPTWFPIDDALESTVDGKLCLYVSQAGKTRSVFTVGWLCEVLDRAGWSNPTIPVNDLARPLSMGPEWLTDLDSRLEESIIVEAQA